MAFTIPAAVKVGAPALVMGGGAYGLLREADQRAQRAEGDWERFDPISRGDLMALTLAGVGLAVLLLGRTPVERVAGGATMAAVGGAVIGEGLTGHYSIKYNSDGSREIVKR